MERQLAVLALAALAACGGAPTTTVEGSCVATVNVRAVLYAPSSAAPIDPADVVPDPHAVVTRYTGCLDQGEGRGDLAHGESNFLREGTTLHEVAGYTPEERLAYSSWSGEWLALEPWR